MARSPFFGGNLIGQEPFELRGTGDARTRSTETTLATITTGAWTDYTPTLTASVTNPTLGTGATQHGRYARIGRTITGKFIIHFGTGATSGSGAFRIALPVAALAPPTDHYVLGGGYCYNVDNGNVVTYDLLLVSGSATAEGILHEDVAAPIRYITEASPFSTGWTAGDRIVGHFSYEASS